MQQHDFCEKKIEFGYTPKSPAVYSTNIKGKLIDLNTYMNQKHFNLKYNPIKEIEEIDNLVNA